MNNENTQSKSFQVPPEETTSSQVVETLAKVGCQANTDESIIIEVPSQIKGLGPVHPCSVVVTNQRFIFCDYFDKQTYEVSRADIESSTIRRFYGRHLIIKLKDGQELTLIRLDKGNLERLVAAIGKELPPNTILKDLAKSLLLWILIFMPVMCIGCSAFLADKYPAYGLPIIGLGVSVPLFFLVFFFGRIATVWCLGASIFAAIVLTLQSAYPPWVNGVVLLMVGGICLLGEAVRAVFRKSSQ